MPGAGQRCSPGFTTIETPRALAAYLTCLGSDVLSKWDC